MSNPHQQEGGKGAAKENDVKPSVPSFRYVHAIDLQPSKMFWLRVEQVLTLFCLPRRARFVAMRNPETEIIDKSSFFSKPVSVPVEKAEQVESTVWVPTQLRTIPAFYPLEKSSRLVEDETATAVASRLSDCFRNLSVHAQYDNETATASLVTSENVEMHLSLWKTPVDSPQTGILVELQRRTGDSIAFHRYSRTILDAAMGLIESTDMPTAILDDVLYSKRVQRLLSTELQNQETLEHENAIIALEIAHGLIMKDRMDARMLGMESLCLLTDPRKTGIVTATLSSHVVLLGSTQGVEIPGVQLEKSSGIMMEEGPFQEIRESILNLVQFCRLGEEEEDDQVDDSIDKEHMTLLHNLALAVLANALDVIENPERWVDAPEDTKPRSRLRTTSSDVVANEFLQQSDELSNKEILSTLIAELGKASHKPHNATLSAKCIGSLCRASDEAKRRAKELGAKKVVSTALDVGVKTHLKLETECKKVVQALERTTEEEEEEN
jgi:hypothetical protein